MPILEQHYLKILSAHYQGKICGSLYLGEDLDMDIRWTQGVQFFKEMG